MDDYERIIKKIVEGQIKGFIKEHPSILDGVDWYKPRKDKATTLINSLSKRIANDLTCGKVRSRIEAALLACPTETQQSSVVEFGLATEHPPSGIQSGWRMLSFGLEQVLALGILFAALIYSEIFITGPLYGRF